jgi:methionyl-tRNA formyltransferase
MDQITRKLILRKPEKIFFFTGAVSWLLPAIDFALNNQIECYVFAVSRHLAEIFDEQRELTFHQVLNEKGISYFHCDDINTSLEFKQLATKESIGIGIGEAYTFNSETLALLDRNFFDFMTIRMPKYRGGAHFTWQILQQSRIGAWYIQMINEKMIPGGYDQAEILRIHEYIIPSWARIPADYFKVADKEGLIAFINFINDILTNKSFTPTWLPENFSLYLPRLYTLKHGYIDWRWTGEEIERFICAFDNPYAGASTFCNGDRAFVKSAQFERGEGLFHPFMNGIIYRIYNGKMFVSVSNGTIIIDVITNENGISILETFKTGFRLYTPIYLLEEAMLFNAEFDAKGLK